MTDSVHLFGRDDLNIIVAPGPGTITTLSLTANLVCRVLFGIIANLACIVPLKNLYRNGEFAAVVLIANIEWSNFDTIINALIWRNDDTSKWWNGEGFCDLNAYSTNFNNALFGTCLLAIMRNLAQQVGLLRANALTVRERRRRNLIQALIIFPLPIIQVAWVWPLTTQRYAVATLAGCSWTAWPSWPYMIFFVLAPVVVALITSGYAVLTYIRFREIAKSTRSAVNSSRSATQRAQRTKRRLYLMVLAILIPYLPLVIALAVLNMLKAFPLESFDYSLIHDRTFPYPWSSIIFVPSSSVNFGYLNNCYIDILSAIPVVFFFGMTKDAMNSYRRGLLFFGFGRCFPKLHEEYDPDRTTYGSSSGHSRLVNSTTSTASSLPSKIRTLLSHRTFNSTSSASLNPISSHSAHAAPTTPDYELGRELGEFQTTQSPLREISYPPLTALSPSDPITLPPRNPFFFRTRLDMPTIPLPSLSSFRFGKKKYKQSPLDRGLPLNSLPSVVSNRLWEDNSPAQHPRKQTLVWADREDGSTPGFITTETSLLVPASSTYSVTTEPLGETYRR
ncbi:pheromone a factor receptor [Fusarium austroafricanum]|uniref:Pheromone a factor receptor n=1 Tax=Fusarium austroafricanum TaxID=2364996 RepID=A0A8H4P519_9HYPO|nr:pheromone a factor receptor [Fusarium austroafricanum]